jgi:hypothetical protein
MSNNDKAMMVMYLLAILLIVGVVIFWTVLQWSECRDAGMSVFYCIKHVS